MTAAFLFFWPDCVDLCFLLRGKQSLPSLVCRVLFYKMALFEVTELLCVCVFVDMWSRSETYLYTSQHLDLSNPVLWSFNGRLRGSRVTSRRPAHLRELRVPDGHTAMQLSSLQCTRALWFTRGKVQLLWTKVEICLCWCWPPSMALSVGKVKKGYLTRVGTTF